MHLAHQTRVSLGSVPDTTSYKPPNGVSHTRGGGSGEDPQYPLHQFPRSRWGQYFNICSAAEGKSSASALTADPTACLEFCFLKMRVICFYRPSSWHGGNGARLLCTGKSLRAGLQDRLEPRASKCCGRGPCASHGVCPRALPTPNGVTPFVASHPLPSARTSHARCSKAPCKWDSRCGPGESEDTTTAVMEESPPQAGGRSLREELCLLLPWPWGPHRHFCTKDHYISPCKFAMSAYLM